MSSQPHSLDIAARRGKTTEIGERQLTVDVF